MKKTSTLILSALAVSFIIPSIALASWWNPFTWNIWKFFPQFNKPVKTEVIKVDDNKNNQVATTTQAEVNYKATGNLIKNNPGLKPDVWYLSYEKPGSAGLNVELKFNNVDITSFFQGERVSIEGNLQDTVVTVSKITSVPTVASHSYVNVGVFEIEQVYGFSFKTDDPSIVSPFTKELVLKKNGISDKTITDAGGKLFYKNDSEIIIKLKKSACGGDDYEYPPIFVYANKNSDYITQISFADDYKFKVPENADYVKSMVSQFVGKIRPTKIILQQPPTDKVADGYYYAKVDNWNSNDKKVGIDFLTIEAQAQFSYFAAFDILMSSNNCWSTPYLNQYFENNLVNVRTFSVSDDVASKIVWETKNPHNYPNEGKIVLFSPTAFQEIWGDKYIKGYLIKITDGIVVQMTEVGSAG